MAGALFEMPGRIDYAETAGPPQGVDIKEIFWEFVRPYLRQALVQTAGNKTHAAKLLGLKSQQTLSNWMEKYGID